MNNLNMKLIEDFKAKRNKNLNDFELDRNTLKESICQSLVNYK